ncbi:MAG: flagellar basal body-associated FliL family protein [Porticoccus sp.]|nr:flagellar basal body-associated FliL family protein [Porticoccus sp.]
MAKVESELNLGKDDKPTEQASAEPAKGKGGMKKIIIIVVALLIVGGAAAFFLMAGDSSDAMTDEANAETEQVVEEEEQDPIYHELVKDFVVTFEGEDGIRYLQLSLQVMSYQQEVIDRVDANMPAVRNGLIMLIGGQNYEDLKTNEGKEVLRKAILDSVQKAARLKANQRLEDVLFTGFVLQ